jgi:hypothetical protein
MVQMMATPPLSRPPRTHLPKCKCLCQRPRSCPSSRSGCDKPAAHPRCSLCVLFRPNFSRHGLEPAKLGPELIIPSASCFAPRKLQTNVWCRSGASPSSRHSWTGERPQLGRQAHHSHLAPPTPLLRHHHHHQRLWRPPRRRLLPQGRHTAQAARDHSAGCGSVC